MGGGGVILKKLVVIFLVIILLVIPRVGKTQSDSTLADSLKTWLDNVSSYGNDILSTHYGVIFGKLNASSYDVLAQRLLNEGNWQQIIYLKRVCEISNYNSGILRNALLQALENITMLGAIPQSYVWLETPVFLVYHRYLINAYRYAEDFNLTSKWNKQMAFEQFAGFVDRFGGGFLMCTESSAIGTIPVWGNVDQNQTRYYDEQAECLQIFSMFSDMGVVGAGEYALRLWNHLNDDGWWDEQGWYWYRPAWKTWECEMGGFALVVTNYMNRVTPEVLSDVNWKLLRSGWASGCWADNVIVHAYNPVKGQFDNPQRRPLETNTVWHALQSLYSEMSVDMKGNVTSMLTGNSSMSPAWMLSMNSGWFSTSDRTKLDGAMVMFLTGIVPVTGSLDLGFIEEDGSNNIAAYSSANLRFDYDGRSIRIPVKQGELKFLFGTAPTTWNFTERGTYDVKFADDWNSITGTAMVSNSSQVCSITDINKDGIVDIYDVVAFSVAFGSKVGDSNWNERADINLDRIIDLYDAMILANNFNQHY